MAYLRYLTYNDYLAVASQEHIRQLIHDIPERFSQAERRAEQNMLEYLDQYYEIEKELCVGRKIREYNPAVTYPAQVFIKSNNDICRTLTSINGYKKPTKKIYWRRLLTQVDPDKIAKYSQLRMYSVGDVVVFGTEVWECVIPHGYDAGEIHIPGAVVWKEVEAPEWIPNVEYEKNQVCSYNHNFYVYLGRDTAIENVLTPEEDDAWGLIADYSIEVEYDYSEGAFDYVVAENAVFYPVMNPNAEMLKDNENIMVDDCRNPNVVSHMTSLAVYYLHQSISPTNISETRRMAYEDSMKWLQDASKFKINPQIPRKKNNEDGLDKVDWALATYQKSYDPNENSWLI